MRFTIVAMRAGFFAAAILALGQAALAGEPAVDPTEEAGPELKAEIERKIIELGDEEFAVRERAEERLKAIGRPAAPELRKAVASKDEEVRQRAERILAAVERAPSDADLLRLAADLEAIVRNPKLDDAFPTEVRRPTIEEGRFGGIWKRVGEFRERHAPRSGSATFASRDGKTIVVCLGAPATKTANGASAEARGGTRWVVAAGGQGLLHERGGLPGPGERMPLGLAGDASAEAARGIAVAVGGDGMVIRLPGGGAAGGGPGGDAKAVSPVRGVAIGGRDRAKCVHPELDGKCEGCGTDAALLAFLEEEAKGEKAEPKKQ